MHHSLQEIPVNIVDLGLIYDLKLDFFKEKGTTVEIKMTLTAPGCGMADVLVEDIRERINLLPKILSVEVELVLDPPWSMEMMSEAARLEAGLV